MRCCRSGAAGPRFQSRRPAPSTPSTCSPAGTRTSNAPTEARINRKSIAATVRNAPGLTVVSSVLSAKTTAGRVVSPARLRQEILASCVAPKKAASRVTPFSSFVVYAEAGVRVKSSPVSGMVNSNCEAAVRGSRRASVERPASRVTLPKIVSEAG